MKQAPTSKTKENTPIATKAPEKEYDQSMATKANTKAPAAEKECDQSIATEAPEKECDEPIATKEIAHQQALSAAVCEQTQNISDTETPCKQLQKLEKAEAEEPIAVDNKIFIVLRGYPGAGKSTLCRAIKAYYGESNCIACSYDKYHWSGNDDGKGEFKFNPSIHKQTKQWCKDEIMQSFENNVSVIIADNAHFEKWEYAKFITAAQTYHYRVLVIEIRSETPHIARVEHLKHMQQKYRHKQCLLCTMQHDRCKMRVADHILSIFINKWQNDANAIVVDPKLDETEQWSTAELKKLLSTSVVIDCNEYDEEEYDPNKYNGKHNQRTHQSKRSRKRRYRDIADDNATEYSRTDSRPWKRARYDRGYDYSHSSSNQRSYNTRRTSRQ